MRLAFAEMRRNLGRYLAVTAAIGFIVFLVLILAGLADGLYYGATGAYRSGGADLYTFDENAQRSIVRSELPADTAEQIRNIPGVRDAGAMGIQLGSTTTDTGQIDVALVGVEPGRPGGPVDLSNYTSTSGAPIAVADSSLRSQGIRVGDLVTLTGASTAVEVVDFVDDTSFLLAGTLWTDLATWSSIRTEIIPELAFRGDVVEAVAISTDPESDTVSVIAAIDGAGLATETVTTDEAIAALPGVEQQQSTFQSIIITSFVVVGIVTALFFALITLEKRGLIAVLKAIGAENRTLLAGVVVQGFIATTAGFVVGFGLSRLTGALIPSNVPVTFLTGTAAYLLVATIAMGTIGAAASFRRISNIDPATALGGGT
jgi:putative ABC transport system permease protein